MDDGTSQVESIVGAGWSGGIDAALADRATAALEAGSVLRLPLPFVLEPGETRIVRDHVLAGHRKNVSLGPRAQNVKGAVEDAGLRRVLASACGRYQRQTAELAQRLFPAYLAALEIGRTSFRPAEVAGRVQQSPRKDDTRLHIDAFPATPVHGRRVLRFFTNVNPDGVARHWQVGEPFEQLAATFLPRVPRYSMAVALALAALRVTKSVRSEYDHCMRHIHDIMKCDTAYQRAAARQDVHFAAGETWIVFSDQVVHAVLSGRCMFEQTIYLPVTAQRFPVRSPLRVLERLTGRALA
ncbi:MAG: Kdo hydroxylase family protein [Burkholderiales bacterium]|nr:Kdo hydroxylase family protein [Burkholderiales bacterium]